MVSVIKLSHLGIVAKNYDAMLEYYTSVLGFELVQQTPGTSYLRIGVDHHAIALHKAGDKPGLQHIAFQIDPKYALADVVKDLSNKGIASQIETDSDPNTSELVSLHDCMGTRLELYTASVYPPKICKATGISPIKLGHVARSAVDVKRMCDYYETNLGFRVSDWIEDFFVFLRCNPIHHSINIVAAPTPSLHHIAYEVNDWAHIQKAADILATHDIPLIWGPLRHGPGHNIAVYHLDPDGNRIELYCQLDVMLDERLGYFETRPWHEDNPQRPKVWIRHRDGRDSANKWGLPPAPMMRG